jgi:hypothetical protein
MRQTWPRKTRRKDKNSCSGETRPMYSASVSVRAVPAQILVMGGIPSRSIAVCCSFSSLLCVCELRKAGHYERREEAVDLECQWASLPVQSDEVMACLNSLSKLDESRVLFPEEVKRELPSVALLDTSHLCLCRSACVAVAVRVPRTPTFAYLTVPRRFAAAHKVPYIEAPIVEL